MSVWIGAMNTEWMIERGGVEAFQELAITRSRLLYAASGIYRGRIWGWRILEICVFFSVAIFLQFELLASRAQQQAGKDSAKLEVKRCPGRCFLLIRKSLGIL